MAHELTEGDWERIAEFARTRQYDRNPDMLRPGEEGDERPEENPLVGDPSSERTPGSE